MAAPSKIGRYEILKTLGHGGKGARLLARDPVLDRLVTGKPLAIDDDELSERVVREARAVARLNHPNIETILEVGEDDGRPFIAAEYIQGETLAEIIRRHEPLSLTRKIQIVEDVCARLEYAHRSGMIHRDLTPSNIMVTSEGVAKILDFGGVRHASTSNTQAGMIIGALNYLSPEQLSGSSIDHRSDVFALGAVLYELVTAKKAFPGDLATGALQHIVADEPAPASSLLPTLPAQLDGVISSSLQKDPSLRYQDAVAMRRDLSRIRQRLEREESDGDTSCNRRMRPLLRANARSARAQLDRTRSCRHRLARTEAGAGESRARAS